MNCLLREEVPDGVLMKAYFVIFVSICLEKTQMRMVYWEE